MRAVARLSIMSGAEGILFLRSGRYVIGRRSDCDFIIEAEGISRQHAIIELDGISATIFDQNSRNGTHINSTAIDKATLQHGTIIRMAECQFLFEWLDHTNGDDQPTPSLIDHPDENPALTAAQQRVLVELLAGLSEKAIAAKLDLSKHTVHNHIKAIYAEYRVNSRSELLARFITRPSS